MSWHRHLRLEIEEMFAELSSGGRAVETVLMYSTMRATDQDRVRSYMRDVRARDRAKAKAWRDAEKARRHARMAADPEFAAAQRAKWRDQAVASRAKRRATA